MQAYSWFFGKKRLVGFIILSMLCAFVLWPEQAVSQVSIRGKVTDVSSGRGLSGVTVSFEEGNDATSTDSLGYYELSSEKKPALIRFHVIGYYDEIHTLNNMPQQVVNIMLRENIQFIETVVVRGGRYRNQNNPAVQLIQQVIAHKEVNNPEQFEYRTFEEYEKILMAASDIPKGLTNSRLTSSYRFAFENLDSTLVPGRPLLPLFLEENIANRYERRSPKASKTVNVATQKTELDKRFVNNENIQTYLKFIHGDIDIYQNNILVLNRPFLSPLSDNAPVFYKFYIADTIKTDEGSFVVVEFMPRNEKDALFTGILHISLDGKYGIRQADLKIGGTANMNWINDIDISLRFQRHSSGIYLLYYSDARYNFGIANSKRGLFGQRTVVYSALDTDSPINTSIFSGQLIEQHEDARLRDDSYWQQKRPFALTKAEARTYSNVDSLNRNQGFRRMMDWGYLIMSSYKQAGPVDIGPAEYIYSFHPVDGNRIRLGGRTNRSLSEKFYVEGYGAYGFRDERWKYFVGAGHTLNKRRINEYPAHYIYASYQYDVREPGLPRGFYNGDSFMNSFRASKQDKWTYYRELKLQHVIEFGNHVMLQTSFAHLAQSPTSQLYYINGLSDTIRTMQTADIGVKLRWAPGEEFQQRNLERKPIINGFPVFSVSYNRGVSGIFGGEYDYQTLRFDVFKRIFLSQLGYADMGVGVGYIDGTIPFPLLDVPNTNQSYVLAPDTYKLMNNLEFVSDRYVKLSVEQHFLGFFLNKIPFVKKLKIRELASFRMLYGGVRTANRPQFNTSLFAFPTNVDGQLTTFTLERKPYMEATIGLENIFSLIRIEYVKRLSYLHHPNVRQNGIRFSAGFTF